MNLNSWRDLPGEANQSFRQVRDPHRLAHIEHQDVAVPADGEGLQYQADGLGNGHEKAGDFRVRDGDGLIADESVPGRAESRCRSIRGHCRSGPTRSAFLGPAKRRESILPPAWCSPLRSSGSPLCRTRSSRNVEQLELSATFNNASKPKTLLLTASSTLASIMGTCL